VWHKARKTKAVGPGRISDHARLNREGEKGTVSRRRQRDSVGTTKLAKWLSAGERKQILADMKKAHEKECVYSGPVVPRIDFSVSPLTCDSWVAWDHQEATPSNETLPLPETSSQTLRSTAAKSRRSRPGPESHQMDILWEYFNQPKNKKSILNHLKRSHSLPSRRRLALKIASALSTSNADPGLNTAKPDDRIMRFLRRLGQPNRTNLPKKK
jgi:hypothetical protein